MGHHVAIVCDARTGGPAAEKTLRHLEDVCELGIFRLPMSRQIGVSDYFAYRQIRDIAANRIGAEILHGHGAKGGAYARLASRWLKRTGNPVPAFYTPHGGSLHYDPASLRGRLYLGLERRLAPMTDGLIFESAFSAKTYAAKVCEPPCAARVIPNGLHPTEFYQVTVDADAADFLFIGELREIKGVDVFLQALVRLKRTHEVKALIVGSGPDERSYRSQARRLGLGDALRFLPPMPARAAFARARCLVVPSRAESLPYIVLEAAAAQMPMIASHVGGIPEIIDDTGVPLVEAGSIASLREQMAAFLDRPGLFAERAQALQQSVSKRYTVAAMAQSVVDFYSDRAHALRAGT